MCYYSGWPADLEFLETWKSQGILAQNWIMSGNFICMKQILLKFFKIHSNGKQELVRPVHISSMLMDFYPRIKMNLNC